MQRFTGNKLFSSSMRRTSIDFSSSSLMGSTAVFRLSNPATINVCFSMLVSDDGSLIRCSAELPCADVVSVRR